VNVIPAIDLQDRHCVRLYQGDFAQATEYSSDPLAVARAFAEMEATDLHIVDLDGARSGTQQNRQLISAIVAESRLAIQLGGGIRDRNTVSRWLSAGVNRCVIGSLAVTAPEAVKSWLAAVGPEQIVLALDVNIDSDGIPMLTTHGWTRPNATSLYDCIDNYLDAGLRHVLCTDVSRDGAMAGPNLQLYAAIMTRYPDLRLQASGGVRDIHDLAALRNLGIPAAITGRALLDGKITATEMASFRQNA